MTLIVRNDINSNWIFCCSPRFLWRLACIFRCAKFQFIILVKCGTTDYERIIVCLVSSVSSSFSVFRKVETFTENGANGELIMYAIYIAKWRISYLTFFIFWALSGLSPSLSLNFSLETIMHDYYNLYLVYVCHIPATLSARHIYDASKTNRMRERYDIAFYDKVEAAAYLLAWECKFWLYLHNKKARKSIFRS